MDHWGKISLSLFLLIFLGVHNVAAQNSQQEPNRLSVGIMGSVTTGHLNLGSAFQSSADANFEFQERLNSTLGFNIRYVATPEIALQSNVVFGKFSFLSDIFPADALTFDNNYVSTTLTTQLSLVRLFGATARNFNLFGSFGTGLMFNDVSIHSEHPSITQSDITAADHPFQTFFTTFGGGLRFNLGHRLDSYAQYEYSSASRDIIDGNFIGELLNLGGSSQISNSWSAVTFGLQFKFGASNVDADWPAVTRVIAPEPPPERSMFERLEELLARQAEMFQEEINQLTGRIDSLELALLEEKQKNEELEMEAPPQNEEMAAMIRELQHQVAELESALAAEREDEQPTIAEQVDEPRGVPSEEQKPEPVAIHRIRIEGEKIGVGKLPPPLPVEIILVPDEPETPDTELLAESTDTPEDEITEAEPQIVEAEETISDDQPMEEISPGEEAEVSETVAEETDAETDQTAEPAEVAETLAETELDKTETVEEKREDIIRRADSLRVIESIEELDSTDRGMSPVRSGVTRPDTADLETPKPQEKEPELPIPDFKKSQSEKDTGSEAIASADIDTDDAPVADEKVETKAADEESTVQVDSDTTEMDEEMAREDQASESMDATEQPADKSMNWTWYALIAIAILGAIYAISKIFKPKSPSDSDSA